VSNKPCSIIGRLNGLKDYRQGSDNVSAKTQEYLQAGILVVILILLIIAFDLPKDILINLAITIPFVIFLYIVFPHKNKGGRKRNYIFAIVFFLVFAILTYIFDLPKKLYFFFGITAASVLILEELFNLINKKNTE